MNIEALVRNNIRQLEPYSSARDEFKGSARVWLDANENPFENGLNRYPDPYQRGLKSKLSSLKKIKENQIFIGNGSDEIIDLLIRAFCEPREDCMLICPPTYGMYAVSAGIHDVEVISCPLNATFQLNMSAMLSAIKEHKPKLIFLCSPNNPTGNTLHGDDILTICRTTAGLVILDEAYIDFAPDKSLLHEVVRYPNLIIMQTFSKARGLAGIRLGFAHMHKSIVAILNKIKPPYNINSLTQQHAMLHLENADELIQTVDEIIQRRKAFKAFLESLSVVQKVYSSEANFLLVQFRDAGKIYALLIKEGIVVRDRQHVLKDALRITIGTENEMARVMDVLKKLSTS